MKRRQPVPVCVADESAPCLWDGQDPECPCVQQEDPEPKPARRGRRVEDVPVTGGVL